LALRALTRPQGAELTISVTPSVSGCPAPESLKEVQVKAFALDGALADVRNLQDVPSPAGTADLTIGALVPRQLVDVQALVQAGVQPRTYVLRGRTEAVEFAVERGDVLVPDVAGYGGQFNQHVYANLSASVGVTPTNVLDMEHKMVSLHPQLARIFFNSSEFTFPDRMASFVRTVQLAQAAGATINVTWQGGGFNNIPLNMQRFANVLLDLVQNKGITNLRWVTVQNEPNEPGNNFTMQQWEMEYRTLDRDVAPIRGQVRFMGGDLVRGNDYPDKTNQRVWFDYMASNMSDILDAWSIHVFWDYWDTEKLQARLNEVRAIWDAEPPDERKPLYVSEYGVRGIRTLGGLTANPGFWQDGTPITQTNINAFQHAWFDVLSARLGYLGTIKWDSYFGKYDNGTQAYYMIGPPQLGWPLYPIYNVVHLWTTTVDPGWSVAEVLGESGTKLLTAYTSAGNNETIIGLDTSGAQLNSASTDEVTYTVGGLPSSLPLQLLLWNADGGGGTALAGTVTTDDQGVAAFAAPLNSVFALTTLPIPSP
jgi:hypothetical protein